MLWRLKELLNCNLPSINTRLLVASLFLVLPLLLAIKFWIFACVYLNDTSRPLCNALRNLYNCAIVDKHCLLRIVRTTLLWNVFITADCERWAICIVFVIHFFFPSPADLELISSLLTEFQVTPVQARRESQVNYAPPTLNYSYPPSSTEFPSRSDPNPFSHNP
jgi:hypothetical protein